MQAPSTLGHDRTAAARFAAQLAARTPSDEWIGHELHQRAWRPRTIDGVCYLSPPEPLSKDAARKRAQRALADAETLGLAIPPGRQTRASGLSGVVRRAERTRRDTDLVALRDFDLVCEGAGLVV
jgi:hypothetical protein